MGETKETHVTMQMMHETIEKAEEVMLKCQLENKTKDSLIEKYKTKLLAVMEDNKRLKDDSVKLQSALMQLKGKQQKVAVGPDAIEGQTTKEVGNVARMRRGTKKRKKESETSPV
jgi:hypothetical protein